ncbi:hypothetical protein QCA50_000383 [Cerrena zonata]|uniref:Uncharacterized protein n=1 Tax=Cerrena zonata TaxID=2478898 RepID=A0AAW0GZV4_9APHY
MSSRATTVYTVAGITVLGGLVAYAVYFDYKRRNDMEFRKKLRKEKKKATKTAAQSQPEPAAGDGISPDDLRAALAKVRAEEVPADPEQKEQYFMNHVSIGEQLATQGPTFHLPAALSFYRAMRVYPSPVELIMIFQQTLPPELFKLVMELTNMDVQERVEGYYHVFPPKRMNVSVQDGQQKKKILVAEKDFEPGDVIYKEEPVVTMLDFDLQAKGSHCTHCFKSIADGTTIRTQNDHLNAVYCSTDCQPSPKYSRRIFSSA